MFHARTVEMPVNMIDIVFNNMQFKAQLLIVVFVLFSRNKYYLRLSFFLQILF